MENKRKGDRLQAPPISLSAASLAIGTPPRNQRGAGRRPKFTEEQKAEYQSEFEVWWLLQIKQKQNQKCAIEYVETIIGDIKVGVGTITSQIIRPVLKKLKTKK